MEVQFSPTSGSPTAGSVRLLDPRLRDPRPGLKPLDDLRGEASLLFGYQSAVRPKGVERPGAVRNALMASVPEHPHCEGTEADLPRSREGSTK